MTEPMNWGGYHMGHGEGWPEMSVPMIPAPVAFFTLLVGLMIGLMIGRRRSMMHGMQPQMGCGSGEDWAMKKKMMRKMAAHHHHGEGTPPCRCDEEVSS